MLKTSLRAILVLTLLVLFAACSETKTDDPQSDGDGDSVVDGDGDSDATEPDASEADADAPLADGDLAETESDVAIDGDTSEQEAVDGDTADAERDIPAEAEEDEPAATLGSISIAELHGILTAGSKDFKLINVHIPNQGEIAGTDTHISYLETDALAAYIGTNKNSKVVVYCMSNYMSMIAGNNLVGLGYKAIRYLDGGMSGWQQAGYELVNIPARKAQY